MGNKIYFSLAAAVLVAVIAAAKAEEPMRLMEPQLDTVIAGNNSANVTATGKESAGRIALSVTDTATATGPSTTIYASTANDIRLTRGAAQIGNSSGFAYAAGADAQTATATGFGSGGDGIITNVQIHSTPIVTTGNGTFQRVKVHVTSVVPPGKN